MKLEFPSIVDYGLDRAAEVLTRAFADYFVSIVFDAGTLLQTTRVDSVELASSCIFVRDGTAVGGALIALRGWTSRLAGMAILPEPRRGGVGRTAVNHLLAEAKARKDRRMVLEVIEQNTARGESLPRRRLSGNSTANRLCRSTARCCVGGRRPE